jgi:hypothetical protein
MTIIVFRSCGQPRHKAHLTTEDNKDNKQVPGVVSLFKPATPS